MSASNLSKCGRVHRVNDSKFSLAFFFLQFIHFEAIFSFFLLVGKLLIFVNVFFYMEFAKKKKKVLENSIIFKNG